IRRFELRPMRNLCGHHVGRWAVHRPPPIPNVPEDSGDRLEVDAVLAIEPFATDGLGTVAEEGAPEVFRLLPGPEDGTGREAGTLAARAGSPGLPFSRRDLARFPRPLVEETLAVLLSRGRLSAYAPLVEASGRAVAQAEHTLHVGREGVEVLTR